MSINASIFFVLISYIFAFAYSSDFFIRYKIAHGTKPSLSQYLAFVGGYKGKYFLLGFILIFLLAAINILYRAGFLGESVNLSRKDTIDFAFVIIVTIAYGIYWVRFKKD